LKINIRYPSSKSRDAIIGSIIIEVAKKDAVQIRKFVEALKSIIGREKKGKMQNFFWEWDKIIRET
jgi:hypothetical protein